MEADISVKVDYLDQIRNGQVFLSAELNDSIDIIITGDYCPDRRIEKLCLEGKTEEIYGNMLDILSEKDLSITNLECPLTNRISPILKIGPNLIAHPKCIEAIKAGCFDIVTLANNHIMDQGNSGLIDTIESCTKSNISWVGAGANSGDAAMPLYINKKGKTIAILNFAENEFGMSDNTIPGANPIDIIKNYHQIRCAKEQADIILVIIHGGNEYHPLPSPRVLETYRFFAECGVTAVIGHHTHCCSGFEIFRGVPIFYSLGNFIFDRLGMELESWYEGYVIKLAISDNTVKKIDLIPYVQSKNVAGVRLMRDEESKPFFCQIEEYSRNILDREELYRRWYDYCKSVRYPYLASLIGLNKVEKGLLKYNIYSKRLSKKASLKVLNYFSSESLRDCAIDILKKEISEL